MARKHRAEQEWLSRLDGARMLGISAKTWDRLATEPDFPKPIKVANRVHLKRWNRHEINDWLHQQSPQKEEAETENDGDNPIIDEQVPKKSSVRVAGGGVTTKV